MTPMNIKTTQDFDKEAKRLAKKYPSLPSDLRNLRLQLLENPFQGAPLGGNTYKVRMAIASKGKGKSGGPRVITCVKIVDDVIHLLTIYDKSEIKNITDEYLDELKKWTE
jgi:hypothetical protein